VLQKFVEICWSCCKPFTTWFLWTIVYKDSFPARFSFVYVTASSLAICSFIFLALELASGTSIWSALQIYALGLRNLCWLFFSLAAVYAEIFIALLLLQRKHRAYVCLPLNCVTLWYCSYVRNCTVNMHCSTVMSDVSLSGCAAVVLSQRLNWYVYCNVASKVVCKNTHFSKRRLVVSSPWLKNEMLCCPQLRQMLHEYWISCSGRLSQLICSVLIIKVHTRRYAYLVNCEYLTLNIWQQLKQVFWLMTNFKQN